MCSSYQTYQTGYSSRTAAATAKRTTPFDWALKGLRLGVERTSRTLLGISIGTLYRLLYGRGMLGAILIVVGPRDPRASPDWPRIHQWHQWQLQCATTKPATKPAANRQATKLVTTLPTLQRPIPSCYKGGYNYKAPCRD